MILVLSQVQRIDVSVTEIREEQVDENGNKEFYLGATLTYGVADTKLKVITDILESSKFVCLKNGETIKIKTNLPMPYAFELKVLTTTDSGSYQKLKEKFKFTPKNSATSRACFVYG